MNDQMYLLKLLGKFSIHQCIIKLFHTIVVKIYTGIFLVFELNG